MGRLILEIIFAILCFSALLCCVSPAFAEKELLLKDRVLILEKTVENQRKVILFLYQQLNYTAGSKEPKDPKCLKLFLEGKKGD